MSAPAPIRTEGLGKRFGDVVALADLDLEIAPGEVVGYLGPNGAGKTTTLRLLLGSLRPSSGRATIFGLDVTAQAATAHAHLAYVPGEAQLWPRLTGGQTLDFLARIHGGDDATYRSELIERFQLDPSRRVREYSKGNRQKLALISALATRAPLLLLDEPTAGLDPLMERAFRDSVSEAKQRGQTVLLSSHILSEVEALSDRVAILRAGRLVDVGTLGQLRHLSALSVEIEFAGPVAELRDVPGVHDLNRDGQVVRCHVQGPMTALLAALSSYPVTRLTSREPTLEEVFLRHYGAGPTASGSDPVGPRDGRGEAARVTA